MYNLSHCSFIEEYAKSNVKIWAITTTNEPINGIVPFVQFNSLGWFPHQLVSICGGQIDSGSI